MRSVVLLSTLPVCVFAQGAMPVDFPADAQTVPAEALQQRLAGKVYRATPADGNQWRIDYKANGYAFLDTSRGMRDTGRWRVDGSQLCIEWSRAPSGCNEVRAKGDLLYLKRSSNGEVVPLSLD